MNARQDFELVDSTLREGEQFALAHFEREDRLEIAEALDSFGVEWIEMTSPAASEGSARDFESVSKLGLRARIAAHVRCDAGDIERALDAGAQGLHLFMGATERHRLHGHGRDAEAVLAELQTLLRGIRAHGVELRFSCEDAFRTPWSDLLRLYQAADRLGVARVGLADTVGAASPTEVSELVSVVRRAVDCGIEFHGHNDGGCAVANAHAALMAGATHIDVTVLGIGERNGITPLSGLVARLFQSSPLSLDRYRLRQLPALDALVAERLGIEVPFNACITGATAFSHKAGLHAKAVLGDPGCYESLDPEAFGRERQILVAHALTGRHAIADRARSLGLPLERDALMRATRAVKAVADEREMSSADVDRILRETAAASSEESPSRPRTTTRCNRA